MSGFFRQAITTYAEKVQPMIQNFKFSPGCDLFFHIIQAGQVLVNYFFTFDADDVRMGLGSFTIVPVAAIRETQFKNLANRFNQGNIFIHSG